MSNIKFPELRKFQSAAHQALRQGYLAGHKKQLIMAPTGSGKTILAMWIIHEALQKGKRPVFVCDRTALINQTSAVADGLGLSDHAIIQAQHPRRDTSRNFQIASIQTIAKRGFWPETDLVIVDECHAQHKAWVDFAAKHPGLAMIGLSATPFAKGLGRTFTNLINVTSMHELTEQGILVPMKVYSCTRIDMKGAEKGSDGEWTDRAAEQRGKAIIGDVVAEWQKLSSDRKTIVFGATIKHCEDMAAKFLDAGVMAAVYTSDTKVDERERLVTEFKKPDSILRVLISVEALAKGFDQSDVSCVVDCRPLSKSLSTAIQMWGRGLRSHHGKKDCHLHDHSGNIVRMAEDFTDIFFNGLSTLNDGEKMDKKQRDKGEEEAHIAACPACGFEPFFKRCMACGHEKQAPSMVGHEPGEMKEIVIGKGKNKTKLADDHRHLWEQVCSYARVHSAPQKQSGRAWHLYQKIVGSTPPSEWSFTTTPTVDVSVGVHRKIQQLNIAHANGAAR